MTAPTRPAGYIPHRVLVMLRNGDRLPLDKYPVDDDGRRALGIADVWKVLADKFSDVELTRRHELTTQEAADLESLLRRAREGKRDPGYDYSSLRSYFAIECPPDIDPAKVASWVNDHWKEYLYPAYPAEVEIGPASPIAAKPPDVATTTFTPPAIGTDGYLGSQGIDFPLPPQAPAAGAQQPAGQAPGGQAAPGAPVLQVQQAPVPTVVAGQPQKDPMDDAKLRIVDIEQGWTLDHEAIANANGPPQVAPLVDDSIDYQDYRGHGTAVLGILAGRTQDVPGIVPEDVPIRVVPQWRKCDFTGSGGSWSGHPQPHYDTAEALLHVILDHHIQEGDVILLEAQTNNLQPIELESRYTFDMIRLATHVRGLVVVEPAGNGGLDLKDLASPGSQRKVLDTDTEEYVDSGAILVGAARSTSLHTAMPMTNRGKRVDCFAWGERIFTSGNGIHADSKDNYTPSFGGTSAASAIIAGVAAYVQYQVQEKYKANGNARPYTPSQLREVLKAIRNPAASQSRDEIGVMPSLRGLQARLVEPHEKDQWPDDGITKGKEWRIDVPKPIERNPAVVKTALTTDKLVSQVGVDVGKPTPIILRGWLQDLGGKRWRLYLSLDFSIYIDFSEDDKLYHLQLETPGNPLGGTLLWLKRDAVLTYGQTAPLGMQAEFMRGDLVPAQFPPFVMGGRGGSGRTRGARDQTGIPACSVTIECGPPGSSGGVCTGP